MCTLKYDHSEIGPMVNMEAERIPVKEQTGEIHNILKHHISNFILGRPERWGSIFVFLACT